MLNEGAASWMTHVSQALLTPILLHTTARLTSLPFPCKKASVCDPGSPAFHTSLCVTSFPIQQCLRSQFHSIPYQSLYPHLTPDPAAPAPLRWRCAQSASQRRHCAALLQ